MLRLTVEQSQVLDEMRSGRVLSFTASTQGNVVELFEGPDQKPERLPQCRSIRKVDPEIYGYLVYLGWISLNEGLLERMQPIRRDAWYAYNG